MNAKNDYNEKGLAKFKDYMSLCGIYTVLDLHRYSDYPKSVQWLRTVLRDENKGQYFNQVEYDLCYKAVNVARMNMMNGIKPIKKKVAKDEK